MCTDTKSDMYSDKIIADNLPENTHGRYLSHSEMEQFKMDCPVCGLTVNLIDFSQHLKKDIAEIRTKYEHAD